MSGQKYRSERLIDGLKNQVEREISIDSARELLASGYYHKSTGLSAGAHYRRNRGSGCYHLRVRGGRAWLHWDRWDPRRHAIEHFFETPALWATTGVAAVALVLLKNASQGSRTVTYDSETGRYRDEAGRFTRSPR